MKRVFISSPYRGDEEANVTRAWEYVDWVYQQGHLPYSAVAFMGGVVDWTDPAQVERGLQMAFRELVLSDELWIFVPPVLTPSDGILREISLSRCGHKPIKWLDPNTFAFYARDIKSLPQVPWG